MQFLSLRHRLLHGEMSLATKTPREKSGEMVVICKLINKPATLPCIPGRVATDFYNSIPVSSSHGLTSMRRLDLAMTAFSAVKKTLKKQQKTVKYIHYIAGIFPQ